MGFDVLIPLDRIGHDDRSNFRARKFWHLVITGCRAGRWRLFVRRAACEKQNNRYDPKQFSVHCELSFLLG